MDMRVGDVVLTTSLKIRDQPVKPTLELGYKAPKGEGFVVMILGTTDGKTPFDAEKALNALGWYFKE